MSTAADGVRLGALASFDYLVVVDLETTCDDQGDPNRQEIVEWPWVVYDVAARRAVDHKQIFVAPAWNTNPNPPPSAVRGLGLDVAFAASLKEAVQHFDAYLYHSFATHAKSFCILTDGPWDVQHLLLLEAARKAVPLSPHFRAFFNLRAEFTVRYPHVGNPRDRHAMLAALGISRTPSNTGIDHCVAIADIVSRMLYDGHFFSTPFVIPEYDWSAAASRVPAVAAPVAAAVPVGGIVRLRGLPWAATEMDIVRFLQPIAIVPAGIHFVRNAQGKATGEAFVQLESEEAVKAALARNRQSIGRRYIEVFKSSPNDMTNHLGRADQRRLMHQHSQVHKSAAAAAAAAAAVAGSPGLHGGRNGRGSRGGKGNDKSKNGVGENGAAAVASGSVTGLAYVVHVSGLPIDTVADDLLGVFDGLEMLGDGIHLVPREDDDDDEDEDGVDGREAFVLLTSESWAKKACQRTGRELKGCKVNVRRSTPAELRAAVGAVAALDTPRKRGNGRRRASSASSTSPSSRGGNGGGNGASPAVAAGDIGCGTTCKTYVMEARNLDAATTVDGITKLFAGFGVGPGDVTLTGDDDGAVAVARVAFLTEEARDLAVALEAGDDEGILWCAGGESMGRVRPRDARVVRMRGLPYSSTDDDIVAFFDGFDIDFATGGIARGKDRHGRASGEAWVTLASNADAQRAVLKLDKAHIGTRYIELIIAQR